MQKMVADLVGHVSRPSLCDGVAGGVVDMCPQNPRLGAHSGAGRLCRLEDLRQVRRRFSAAGV